MKNIFEGAKFGDKFKTRDGHCGIFVHYIHRLGEVTYICKPQWDVYYSERTVHTNGFRFDSNTEDDWDIVGPWTEEDNFPFDFPSDEEIENKAKEIVETKSKHLEDLYGLPLDDISATAMAGEMQDGLVDMVRWIKDRR